MLMDIPKTPIVNVHTTTNRGHTPEELAQMAVKKIIFVGKDAHPAIREQAEAFASQMERVITSYMKQAVVSDRTTVCQMITDAGHPELAALIRKA